MIESKYSCPLLVGLAAAGGVALCSGSAFSQSNAHQDSSQASLPQITIEASHEVRKKQVGMSYTGIPIEEVTLSRHVSYRDLDLNTPSGVAALDKRIKATAQEACNQLKTLYPLDMWRTDNPQCVSAAVQGAMQQVKGLESH